LFTFALWAIVLGFVTYPSILILSWFDNERIRIGQVCRFISSSEIARNVNTQLIEEYKILVFAPNVIGAFTTILAKHFEVLEISEEIIIGLLISHFCLIVLTTIGQAFLRMASTRTLLIFIGEVLMEWALVSGSILFIFQIVGALYILLILIVAFFLIAYGYFRMRESATIYAHGAMRKLGMKLTEIVKKDEFEVKVVQNLKEASKLAEDGFEKFDEIDGNHIYRKRK
jgi:hypothetical protein